MKSTERFSTRVDVYREHRPRYPHEVVDVLRQHCGLAPQTIVADVAAGTGLLAEIFLAKGNPVIAIEPNAAMRAACEELQEQYSQLTCVAGTAEATGLADDSVDMVTVGQALHWFDLPRTRVEFARVLRPNGWCVVIYNHRRMRGDAFHEGYEQILVDFGKDYPEVRSRHLTEDRLQKFFAPNEMRSAELPTTQALTREGLRGRMLSSSYMPLEGDETFPAMTAAMDELFARHAKDGVVRMEYETALCWGSLTSV